jgi:hypothetical protein
MLQARSIAARLRPQLISATHLQASYRIAARLCQPLVTCALCTPHHRYWTSAGERKGSNPLADPLAIIGILAIFFPFILLLLAVGTGYIDLSVYRY